MGKLRPGRCHPLWLHIWSLRLDLLVPLRLASILKANISLSALGWVIPAGYLALTLEPTDCSSFCTCMSSLEFSEGRVSLLVSPEQECLVFSPWGCDKSHLRKFVLAHSLRVHSQDSPSQWGGSRWRGHGAPTAQECSPSQWGGVIVKGS